MKVTWSPKAIDDLAEILDYIEFVLDSPKVTIWRRYLGAILETNLH